MKAMKGCKMKGIGKFKMPKVKTAKVKTPSVIKGQRKSRTVRRQTSLGYR